MRILRTKSYPGIRIRLHKEYIFYTFLPGTQPMHQLAPLWGHRYAMTTFSHTGLNKPRLAAHRRRQYPPILKRFTSWLAQHTPSYVFQRKSP